MDSDDRLAAARKAAARMAASAVFAGRSAAVAVRSEQLSMQTFEARNRRHERHDVAEHLFQEHLEDREERQRFDTVASVATTVAKANQAVAAAALRAQTTHRDSEYRSPGPKPVSSPRVPKEQSDGFEMCEWDVTVQRTFITVVPAVPLCKRLISTVSAPPRLDHARRRRHTRRRARDRGKQPAMNRRMNLASAAL
eukprot:s2791_g7.t1